jgi:hypothetical protein
MINPSRDDPRWWLFFAVRNLSTLGALLFVMGMLVSLPVLLRGKWWGGVIVAVVLICPGAAMIVTSVMVKQRKRWAVISGIVLTCTVSAVASFLGLLVIRNVGAIDLARGHSPAGALMLAVLVLLIVLNLKAAYRLSRSFPALTLPDLDDRGFEPILATPVQVVLPVQTVDNAAAGGANAFPVRR